MMVFLVTIFAIVAFDTNKAIYNRIIAQNAVDSAADSAALWQARFCNVEQQLNNLHYTVDEAMCIAEGVSTVMCGAAVPLEVIQNIPFCDPEAEIAYAAACVLCDFLPAEDHAQHIFYDALVGKSSSVQELIADAAPFLVFANADACAYGSGANNIFDAAIQTATEYFSDGVSMIPGADSSSLTGALSSINSAVGSTLGQIPIYAFPLNPTALSLDVNPTNNDQLPEKWPSDVPYAGNILGLIGCEEFEYPYEDAASEVDYDPNGDESHSGDTSRMGSGDDYHPTWGWNDQYEYGNPGYMTWIAGVTNAPEILGLGNLVWLNSYQSTVPTSMYWGSATTNPPVPFSIPSYIAIASSQVEGTTVVCNGDVNATPVLIRVVIPPISGTNYTLGSSIPFPFTIYH
jgi:hypothetical protein